MTLTPYLKLMLEKNADSLSLKAGSPALLGLAGEEYPLGKNELSPNIIREITFSLINDAQKQELVQNKALDFKCAAPDGEKFRVSAKVEDNGLVLLIVPDSAQAKTDEPEPVSYQILGATPEDDLNILPYLAAMAKLNASDLFLTVDSPVKAKIYGKVVALDDFLLTPELTQSGAFGIMTQEQIDEFLAKRDLDFAITLPDGSARFRANAFYQRKTVGLVMRLIPSVIPTGKDLGTPDILMELIMAKRGLLLMVGGTGSGKSTTLAAMINHRNANSAGHILTIEDPVEFSHPNLMSIVNQREVGVDTDSYARALKACLREAPDVILIGEIRDRETMSAALELANTGHLCISTMHSNNANQAMERVVNMFPHDYHAQLFMDLATNLNAVISQRLIPDTAGKRCAAIEVMINTPHIASLILKGELNEIKSAMASSGSKGMRTFDDALYGLYKEGLISLEEALKNADSSNDLEAKINFG
ncbi:twitching motility protein PilU [Methylobacter tundripaludum]|uniref:Twitching motility protein PilU n=1 Tax=Methylobacter tundripaludum TaxID=173365 RepID=A0A2S6H2J1_9GAMM|nr:PilT/PilU family type 4a pilus ATPase [Methylobacter tundripaludum]PPK71664.1 twitching motility protein PilU [Methylobacter tundripaludum]